MPLPITTTTTTDQITTTTTTSGSTTTPNSGSIDFDTDAGLIQYCVQKGHEGTTSATRLDCYVFCYGKLVLGDLILDPYTLGSSNLPDGTECSPGGNLKGVCQKGFFGFSSCEISQVVSPTSISFDFENEDSLIAYCNYKRKEKLGKNYRKDTNSAIRINDCKIFCYREDKSHGKEIKNSHGTFDLPAGTSCRATGACIQTPLGFGCFTIS